MAQLLVLGTPEVVLTDGREPVVGTRRQTLLAMLSTRPNADVGVEVAGAGGVQLTAQGRALERFEAVRIALAALEPGRSTPPPGDGERQATEAAPTGRGVPGLRQR